MSIEAKPGYVPKAEKAFNILAKWRTVFAGWQLGTRTKDDAEGQAVRYAAEQRLIMRAELSAVIRLLIEKGVFTAEEFDTVSADEAMILSKALEKRFPGYKADENGMIMNVALARDTMANWRP
jgi:hypothetical protein